MSNVDWVTTQAPFQPMLEKCLGKVESGLLSVGPCGPGESHKQEERASSGLRLE